MRRLQMLFGWLLVMTAACALNGFGYSATAHAAELKAGTWTGGLGFGFLRDTPDDTAFAVNLSAERFVVERLSLGPLLQLGFTDDSSQVGLSGQLKYWIDIPDTSRRLRVNVQGGLGFVHNSYRDGDTSWLIPFGVGADYAFTENLNVTGTFLLNLTDLDTGRGSDAHVMPGLTFGIRF